MLVAVILLYSIFAFFLIYHLARFGVGPAPKLAAFIFFIGSIILVLIAVIAFFSSDFSILEN